MTKTPNRRALLLMATCALAAPPLGAQTAAAGPSIAWTVRKTGRALEREATIVALDAGGRPLAGADIEVSVEMASMPGAHHVRPVTARPTATPGTYTARFALEMAGEWTARIDVKAPQKARFFRKFHAD